jgi:hypothetical protein
MKVSGQLHDLDTLLPNNPLDRRLCEPTGVLVNINGKIFRHIYTVT